MDFTLSKQHEMARTLFSEFAEKEVKPLAQEVDETEKFPRETVEKMAKAGFLGIPVPKELGGQGNKEMMDTIKEYAPSGNPNVIKDIDKATELLNRLNALNVPE